MKGDETVLITENLSTLKIHKLSQAQYERELAAGRIDENALYLTPEEKIDLTTFGVTATKDELNKLDGVTSNVQNQLNDIIDRLVDIESNLNYINSNMVSVLSGVNEPSSNIGNNGDIYLVTE